MRTGKTALILAFLFLAPIGAMAQEPVLKKVSFIPQWVPQAQFAGYYLAHETGIYKEYGIDLAIITGGPNNAPSDLLKSGRARFATMWLSTGIQMRAQGIKVVNIAQMLQRSALMLVAKESSGIKKPRDIDGKKVGLWGPVFQIQPKAFFKKYDLNVKIVPQTFSINLFLRGGVDVASAMWYNEYHTLINSGLNSDELTTFFFHEHGLNFPEDGIYVLEETFHRDPHLCMAFVKASIEGWKSAFSNPDRAVAIVMKNLKKEHIPATKVHQRWMLERMKNLILPEDFHLPMGTLMSEDYYRVSGTLKENGLIEQVPDFDSFYHKCMSQDEE